jgi:uncharacterized protein with LGFP repeats
MKKTSLFIAVLCLTSLISIAQGKSKSNVEDVRMKIIEKANKLHLKPVSSSFTLNYQPLSASDQGKFVYFVDFSNYSAAIYCRSNKSEPFVVWGEIFNKYSKYLTGEPGKTERGTSNINQNYFLGAPTSDEFKTPNKNGAGQHFEGGSMYWSPATGAHEVHGAIKDKWAALGWENSFLGFPVSDEASTPDGYGRFNFFEGGAIYFHPNLGTYAVPKMIAEVWKKEGWEKGKLGYPVSDEIIKNNNSVQYFEFGATISTKARPYKVIYNSLRGNNGLYAKWRATGGADSYLGDLVTPNKNYPKTYQYHFAEFQNGFIYENPSINGNPAFVIKKGPFFDYYASKKWETGYLGFPISDEIASGDNFTIQKFEGGTIFYSPNTGAFEKK